MKRHKKFLCPAAKTVRDLKQLQELVANSQGSVLCTRVRFSGCYVSVSPQTAYIPQHSQVPPKPDEKCPKLRHPLGVRVSPGLLTASRWRAALAGFAFLRATCPPSDTLICLCDHRGEQPPPPAPAQTPASSLGSASDHCCPCLSSFGQGYPGAKAGTAREDLARADLPPRTPRRARWGEEEEKEEEEEVEVEEEEEEEEEERGGREGGVLPGGAATAAMSGSGSGSSANPAAAAAAAAASSSSSATATTSTSTSAGGGGNAGEGAEEAAKDLADITAFFRSDHGLYLSSEACGKF
ncbi:uncharacterized protein LOC116420568 [Sarcophilus harrisii]|uniref:uncharacterized protein LOC116420568 n=1 Tax=Sarcophilus harrisii TaxID=9305 RepID=UPI001301EC09|nr:uncharacterized protein LOC116420568 [Sarcophilus harrisii]